MRLALTFDDGPSQWTEPILDLLADRDAHATFFVLGAHIDGREWLLERMRADGHAVGNHGWSHTRMTEQTDDEIRLELRDTGVAVLDVLGAAPRLWRLPFLSGDQRAIDVGATLGLRHVGFDVDPGDWCGTVDGIVDAVTRASDGAIVDLHDGIPPDGGTGHPDRDRTVAAVGRILALDREFVTVEELWAM